MRDDSHARFEALYDEHADAVLRYARRRCSPTVADDVVAETFVVAWRKLDAVPAEPRAWLLAVARRTLANHRRAERRREALVDRLRAEPQAGAVAAPPGDDGDVGRALAALSERDRELLVLLHWDGLTPGEAQRVLGLTAVAFRARRHRARRRFAEALAHADTALPEVAAARRGPSTTVLHPTKGAE